MAFDRRDLEDLLLVVTAYRAYRLRVVGDRSRLDLDRLLHRVKEELDVQASHAAAACRHEPLSH